MGYGLVPAGQPTPMKPGEFEPSAPATRVSFSLTDVGPPSVLYVQRDDIIVLQGITFLPNEILNLSARILLPEAPHPGQPGVPHPVLAESQVQEAVLAAEMIKEEHAFLARQAREIKGQPITTITASLPMASIFTSYLLSIPLMEGYLLSCAVWGTLGTTRGQTFARAWIARGPVSSTNPNASLVLISDSPTKSHPVSWPGGLIRHPSEGPGFFYTWTVTNPGAGNDWTWTVTAGMRARLLAGACTLTTSATAGTRIPRVTLKEIAGATVWVGAANQSIPASTTATLSMAGVGFAPITDTTTLNCPLPIDTILDAGMKLGTSTVNIQAGDAYTTITLLMEAFFASI
jgi:hypothetical protein